MCVGSKKRAKTHLKVNKMKKCFQKFIALRVGFWSYSREG